MRAPKLTTINGELYEIVRQLNADKVKKTELSVDDIQTLKLWAGGCDSLFKNTTTNEYIFVNKIEELKIDESYDK